MLHYDRALSKLGLVRCSFGERYQSDHSAEKLTFCHSWLVDPFGVWLLETVFGAGLGILRKCISIRICGQSFGHDMFSC